MICDVLHHHHNICVPVRSPAWFAYISRGSLSKLERLQLQRLCLIFSPNTEHYGDGRHICGVDYLSTILEISCLKYVASIKQNPHDILDQSIPLSTKDSHGRLLESGLNQ